MPYIQGSAIAQKNEGSLVQQVAAVDAAISEHVGAGVEMLVTHKNHAFFMGEDGAIKKALYKISKGEVKIESIEVTDEIPIIADVDVPSFVAEQLRDMTRTAMRGEKVSRTQVREVSQLLDPAEEYWLNDVLAMLDEAAKGADWFAMYEANQEKIRTDLYGYLRDIEGSVPVTRYAKIKESQLPELEQELKESLVIMSGLTSDMVDACSKMVFDSNQDDFFSAIRESLKVEAQSIGGLLGKAEKLMRPKDLKVVAEAHDRLAERAKTMAVVVGYLKKRSHADEEQ